MAHFINKTNRAIKAGNTLFVPGKAVEIANAGEFKKLYPAFDAMLKKGDFKELNKAEAKKEETAFAERSVKQLREKAKGKKETQDF